MRHIINKPALFANNRERFTALMKPNTIAIFCSNDMMNRNGDQYYWPYRQNSELYWLTGIAQEETWLMLYPDAPTPAMKTMLFIKETNEHIRIWEGEKFSQKQAAQISGIENIQWNNNFWQALAPLMSFAEGCYLNTIENDRAVVGIETAELRLFKEIQAKYPLMAIERSAPLLRTVRAVKQKTEIDLLQNAVEVTKNAWLSALKMIKPGVYEYEVEAHLYKEIVFQRAKGFSFEPIMAGGKNACVLHYTTNHDALHDGDLMLMDFGADYAYYAGDMTRCVPVNGKFSDRQKVIYNAVLSVMEQAKQLLVPGRTLNEYNMQSAIIMEEALLKLGLITKSDIQNQDPKWPAYKKYFPHGTGHFLGIDVHDIGHRYAPLAPGMVITCEPGIYIAEEGIGIRIENDIVVTEKGPHDLMEACNVPIRIADIEDLMHQ